MPVRVITDSVADLPRRIAEDLGIHVIPLRVRFGETEYRDGIDLSMREFYSLLETSPDFPVTTFPPATDYAHAYQDAASEGYDALVVSISEKLSGTYNAAVSAKAEITGDMQITVIDSRCAAMMQGFVAMKAAKAANQSATLEEAAEAALAARERVHMLSTFRTLEYLYRGGRIGKAKALLGSTLKIHPFIGLKDGLVRPVGAATSRARAIERLIAFTGKFSRIDELAVEHTESEEEAALLVERLSRYHPAERIHVSDMTPVIGAHTGPGLLVVCVLGDR